MALLLSPHHHNISYTTPLFLINQINGTLKKPVVGLHQPIEERMEYTRQKAIGGQRIPLPLDQNQSIILVINLILRELYSH